jgi:hypothetical protein
VCVVSDLGVTVVGVVVGSFDIHRDIHEVGVGVTAVLLWSSVAVAVLVRVGEDGVVTVGERLMSGLVAVVE